GSGARGAPPIVLRDAKPQASPWLVHLCRSAEVTWQGARLCFGTVLTGSKLVDDLDFREQLRALEPEAIGGEMEGAALYGACHDRKVDWMLVKGISDFADGRKAAGVGRSPGARRRERGRLRPPPPALRRRRLERAPQRAGPGRGAGGADRRRGRARAL